MQTNPTPEDGFRKPFAAPPTIFAVAFLVGLVLDFVFPYPLIPILPQCILGAACVLAGFSLIRSSISAIENAGTTYDPYAASTKLITSGIYRFTRNPGYLGLAIIQLGLAVLIDGLWIATTMVIAVLVTHVFVMRLEEEKLRKTFGNEYEQYVARVRPWI